MIESLTRRDFLKMVGVILGGAVLPSCAPEVPIYEREANQAFGRKLRETLGITESSTREDVSHMIYDRFLGDADPAWLLGQELGTFENNQGKQMAVYVDPNGEGYTPTPATNERLVYLTPPKLSRSVFQTPGGVDVGIYGNSETTGRLTKSESVIAAFADRIFSDSPFDSRRFILNMTPAGSGLPFEDFPGFSPEFMNNLISGFGNVYFGSNKDGYIDGAMLTLNTNLLHQWSEILGLAPQSNIIETAGNEVVAVMAVNAAIEKGEKIFNKPQEAVTTVAGWATLFDSRVTRRLVLGDEGGREFSEVLGHEMEILADIARR